MRTIHQEISTDYEIDNDDDIYIPRIDEDKEELFETAAADIDQLGEELRQLYDARTAVNLYGSNPTALAILQTTRLLSGTALESLGLESFQADKPDGAESEMAIESLSEKIREKAKVWSAKILHVAKEGASALIKTLSFLYDKISPVIKKLGEKAWDTTKAAGRVVRAHPFKTIMAVIGTIAATAAIMAYCGSNMPGSSATNNVIESFTNKVKGQINKIPWPFSGVKVSGAENFRIDVVFPPKAAAATAEKLGWSQSASRAMGMKLDQAWASLKQAVGSLSGHASKALTAVGHMVLGDDGIIRRDVPNFFYKHTGSVQAANAAALAAGGVAFGMVISLVWAAYRLVRKLVVGSFKLIFGSLSRLLTFSDVEAA